MKAIYTVSALLLLAALSPILAQQEVERVKVNLMLVDAVVVDGKGQTVPDLTQDDFLLSVAGKAREIETFDAVCPAGANGEPEDTKLGEDRASMGAPEAKRQIVFAFDYYHTLGQDRAVAIEAAKRMIVQHKMPGEEIMLVALANGARIEQGFTSDTNLLLGTLQRMEYDLTLFAMEFLGTNNKSMIDNMSTLMDVLGEYDGSKAVVLFSSWVEPTTTDPDLWFISLAEHSAAARAPIYPVYARGMVITTPSAGSPVLARIANESGGVHTFRSGDLSLGYARAQRDLGCRYTLGFYLQDDEKRRGRKIRVSVNKSGHRVRMPEVMKFFDEKERKQNTLRAAVVDPANFENPYVRGHAIPIRPASAKEWNTLLALHFRMKVSEGGDDLDVVATLERGIKPVGKFGEQFHIDPSTDGSPQPITIYGDFNLKPGMHTLTIAVNKEGVIAPQTTTVQFSIPEVPEDEMFIRGPVLARAVDEGILIRTREADAAAAQAQSALKSVIGETGTFQPLLVHKIEDDETLLALWDTCTLDKSQDLKGATAIRRFLDREKRVALELEPIKLDLGKGKIRCQRMLDTVDASKVGPGNYRFEVVIQNAAGEEITRGLVPLLIEDAEAAKRAALH